jgi:murein DD-endopeptidase MepM/ murein hydrolase activator NlpD
MKHWPVPKSFSKKIPKSTCQGSFWEKRDDRRHCGIDIYAAVGSEVVSVYDGNVVEIDTFTNKEIVPYWNKTKYVLLQNIDGFYCLYAELKDVIVKEKDFVKTGQVIGHVGLVLNYNKISDLSPLYIQKIKNNNTLSMLHFEVYRSKPIKNKKYLGGNWFGENKPNNLIDPNKYLNISFTTKNRKKISRKDIIEKA